MDIPYLVEALDELCAGSVWEYKDDKLFILEGEIVPPTKEQIRLKAEEIGRELEWKALVEGVRTQVAQRIEAHASKATQINMAAAAAGDLFTGSERLAFKAGLAWIAAVRAKGAELIENNDQTFNEDRHWPKPSVEALELAGKY